MKIKLYFIFFILITSLFFSCKEKAKNIVIPNKDTEFSISINPETIDKINPESLFKIVQYIPLETTSKSIFASIIKLKIIDDNIFLFVKINESQNGVLCFDKTGKFIRKIGNEGRGPFDYNNVIDVTFDSKEKKIFLLDINRLLIFDFEGHYIDTKTLNNYYDQVGMINASQGNYLFSKNGNYSDSNSPYNISYFENNKKSSNFFKIPSILQTGSPYFYQRLKDYNNHYYYVKELCDSIVFKFNDKEFLPYVKIDFGKYSLSSNQTVMQKINHQLNENEKSSYKVGELKQQINNYLVSDFTNFLENNQFVMLQYPFKGRYNMIILDKLAKKVFNIQHFLNKRNTIFDSFPVGVLPDNNGLIYETKYSTILDKWADLYELKDERLKKIIKNKDELQNSILVIAKRNDKVQ